MFSCWIQIFFSNIWIGIRRGWWRTENSTWTPRFSFPREKQRVFIFQADGIFCVLWRNTTNSYVILQKASLWNFLANTLLLYIPLLTLTDGITDEETHTLALRGLEEPFFQLCCCVVSVFGSGRKCGTLFSGGLFWDRAGNCFWSYVRT